MKTISFQNDILPLKNILFRLALRITQERTEAEDVVQETMMKVIDPADQSHASNPEQVAIEHDRLHLVRQLIAQLPEKQRTCMQLRDVEGKSYRDIATILDITEQQVKTNIFRARQTIRERFLTLTNEKK